MRQLFPTYSASIDPLACFATDERPTPPGRPWVLLCMITSIDGATAVDGVSGGLGSPGDRQVFQAARSVADVVLVAAGTARTERYGPVILPPSVQAARTARGQTSVPRLAVVTRTLDLDPTWAIFDGDQPALVVTATSAPAARRPALERRTEVIAVGEPDVDLRSALDILRREHAALVVSCEGGPSLNGAMVAAGLVDEVNVSVAPLLMGGASPRLAHGQDSRATPMRPVRILEEDDLLFLQFVRPGISAF